MANQYRCTNPICNRLMKKAEWEEGHRLCPKCRAEENNIPLDVVNQNPQGRLGKHDYKVCDGIIIRVNDKEEADFLKEIYKDYKNIDFEIPDANAQLTALLTYRLEHKRLSSMLVDKRLDVTDRKKISDSLSSTSKAMKDIQDILGITQAKMKDKNQSTQEIYRDHMINSYNYYLENKGHRTAIGICKNCNDRIIMYGNFETLEHELVEELELIENEMLEDDYEIDSYIPPKKKTAYNEIKEAEEKKFPLDKKLAHYITRLKYLLLVRQFPEAYMEYHRKELLKALQ